MYGAKGRLHVIKVAVFLPEAGFERSTSNLNLSEPHSRFGDKSTLTPSRLFRTAFPFWGHSNSIPKSFV